jgi:hypothetical protein
MFRNIEKDYNVQISHLTEKEVVLYIDKILSSNLEEFPNDMILHIDKCSICKKKVLEYKSTFSDMDLEEITLSRLEKSQNETYSKNITLHEEELILEEILDLSQRENEELEK